MHSRPQTKQKYYSLIEHIKKTAINKKVRNHTLKKLCSKYKSTQQIPSSLTRLKVLIHEPWSKYYTWNRECTMSTDEIVNSVIELKRQSNYNNRNKENKKANGNLKLIFEADNSVKKPTEEIPHISTFLPVISTDALVKEIKNRGFLVFKP